MTFALIFLLSFFLFWRGLRRAQACGKKNVLHSLPVHYGSYTALVGCLAGIASYGVSLAALPSGHFLVDLLPIGGTFLAGGIAWHQIHPSLQARHRVERIIRGLFFLSAAFAVFLTFAIAIILIVEAFRFFQVVSFFDFLFGLKWTPQDVPLNGADAPMLTFGAVPLFLGTVVITGIAMLVAVPAGLLSAIYLSCYSLPRTRDIVKPMLEILAGIPTVVYGFFTLVAVSPLLTWLGEHLGFSIAAESALGVGLVMGVMVIPYISSLADDVISSVPRTLRDGSLALGATSSESIKKVILPAAFPGIMASILLAVSRAIGETMLVVMAAGYSARLTVNPLEAMTTVTVQIVSLLTGDQEFNSPKTLAAFALGVTLFFVTLALNVLAIRVVRHYQEKYD